ncbi:MAG: NAD(+)/NADH kinase [Desulfovibrionaceae bacterium]|nr:NAD(+)/NADH kinase [Desulfovibrionaceae bacterium]
MRLSISRLLLIIKEHHAKARKIGQAMDLWLRSRGVETLCLSSRQNGEALAKAGSHADAAVVLGGDGAMLGAARALADLGIPLLGVNFGRVGFLAEVPADDWQGWLEALFAGHFHTEYHTALAWRVLRPGAHGAPRLLASGWAINDVVAARGQVARAVSLDLTADGVLLSRLRCDGLILSTPMGATAYSASSGGPLAFPALDAQIITAISPFAGAFPPLVLPGATPITLTASGDNDDVHLTVDGQESLPLQCGDVVEVHGVHGKTPLLVRDPRWYLRRLGQRGFILPGPGNYALPR